MKPKDVMLCRESFFCARRRLGLAWRDLMREVRAELFGHWWSVKIRASRRYRLIDIITCFIVGYLFGEIVAYIRHVI